LRSANPKAAQDQYPPRRSVLPVWPLFAAAVNKKKTDLSIEIEGNGIVRNIIRIIPYVS